MTLRHRTYLTEMAIPKVPDSVVAEPVDIYKLRGGGLFRDFTIDHPTRSNSYDASTARHVQLKIKDIKGWATTESFRKYCTDNCEVAMGVYIRDRSGKNYHLLSKFNRWVSKLKPFIVKALSGPGTYKKDFLVWVGTDKVFGPIEDKKTKFAELKDALPKGFRATAGSTPGFRFSISKRGGLSAGLEWKNGRWEAADKMFKNVSDAIEAALDDAEKSQQKQEGYFAWKEKYKKIKQELNDMERRGEISREEMLSKWKEASRQEKAEWEAHIKKFKGVV